MENAKGDETTELACKRPPRLGRRGKPKYDLFPGDLVYLYAFECEGHFKIGTAVRWQARLLDLQVGCPFPIKRCRTVQVRHEVSDLAENTAHEYLIAHHVRGEWFKCPRNLVTNALARAERAAGNALPKFRITAEEQQFIWDAIDAKRREFDEARARFAAQREATNAHTLSWAP